MNILVTNDDGIYAKGLVTLVKSLIAKGHEVTVVAPDRNCSGFSHSLTLRKPLVVNWLDKNTAVVQGTPADCVYLAMNGLLDKKPDFVISGINAGENMGDDLLYSGTVAAAIEAYLAKVPSIAVSLAGKRNFLTASVIVCALLELACKEKLGIWNINIPDVIKDDIAGVLMTKQGRRNIAARAKAWPDTKEKELSYWIGPPSKPEEECMNLSFDFGAVAKNYISITPLQIDLTKHENSLEQVFELDLDLINV